MAKRFDDIGDYLSRTANLIDYNSPYTVMFWAKLSVSTGTYGHFWAICSDPLEQSSNYFNSDLVGPGSNGTTLVLGAYVGGSAGNPTGTTMVVGTWYHLAVVRESTTSLKLYVNGVLNITDTGNIGTRTSSPVAGEYMGRFNGGYPVNGCVDAFKSWNVALNSTEVVAEMNKRAHVKTANQVKNTPFLPGTNSLVDGINGYNWTANGAVTDELGPPLDDEILVTETFTTAVSSTWNALSTYVAVQAWGGGGGGKGGAASAAGGGGKGGSYIEQVIGDFSISSSYNYRVGAGGTAGTANGGNGGSGESSWFKSTSDSCAPGGVGSTGTAGATTVNGTPVGYVSRTGGNGGAGLSNAAARAGGGGGSSAGTTANGGAGGTAVNNVAGSGGTAPAGGGNGGIGGVSSAPGTIGSAPGGAGGGGGNISTTLTAGGAGATGKLIISYYIVPAPVPISPRYFHPAIQNLVRM